MKGVGAKRAAVLSIAAIGFCFVFVHASSQTLYKWVDENGVVNYGASVPQGIKDFEQITVDAAPEAPPSPLAQAPGAPDVEPTPPPASAPAPAAADSTAAAREPGEMSLEELDQLCEDAREAAIAPLRQAAVEECKAARRSDPAYCERFYADFGDATGLAPGVVRPRLFNDLPACVLAHDERRNRGR